MPSPPERSCLFPPAFNNAGEIARAESDRVSESLPVASRRCDASVLLTFRHGAARQPDLGEHRRIIAERLVHVRDHLHDLAEQRALAVIDDFRDEVGADCLTVGVELDLAVRCVELDLRQRFPVLRLVVGEIAIDLAQRQD